MERRLVLELASTIRHDGSGGVADDLATAEGATQWLRACADLLAADLTDGPEVVDDALRGEIVGVRRAVRALFARAVAPGPPSSADSARLMPFDEALDRLNAAASRAAVVPRLEWPAAGAPAVRTVPAQDDPAARLVAALARDAIGFLAGPQRELLRACAAPRCVRYFVKGHGRQEWCGTSCGNRARAARHYRRHRGEPDGPAPS
ncbi:CGNR zinc finger domain-containing protein [Streptomyces fragilis]|uniref:CGNR zinc finger domain-containing protein n=1 Tax=Streptomyces fragilis TaxID=67301 RepID=A0ABV2YJ70_9ACTN|nr:CGNR zinc finger domain-containing protein [Streptomyces fragilis]